jgi:hemerythrin-like domain-containing protein
MSYQTTLTAQHRNCDLTFAKIEQAALHKKWAEAASALKGFLEETEAHFDYEENVLFPALQRLVESANGPISVMRSEHAQMRQFFDDLRYAAEKQDGQLLADVTETLLFLMQQHNFKEEAVLYPMADRVLTDDLLARFAESKATG